MDRYLTPCNLPSFPTASQKVVGSSMVRGFPRNLCQLPKEIFWEADFDALEAPRFGASQLPSFPPPKGGLAFGKRRPLEASSIQKDKNTNQKKKPNVNHNLGAQIMTIMERLTGALEAKAKSDAEQYWAAIGNDQADPDLLMTLADRLGKSLADVESDHALLTEYSATPKPDSAKFQKQIKSNNARLEKLRAEIADLKSDTAKKSEELEIMRAKQERDRDAHARSESQYSELLRSLASSGHPQANAELEQRKKIRDESKQRLITEQRRQTLKREIDNIRAGMSGLSGEREGLVAQRLKEAENELQGLVG